MKVYPIVSFKGVPFKQNIKRKEPIPQKNPIEGNSLALLENYNRGTLNLSFKGKSAQEIKEECKEILAQSGRKRGEILTISKNPAIAQIQKEILEHIIRNNAFPNTSCDIVINTIKDNEEIAQIQKEILDYALDNERFGEDEIRYINLSVKNDVEVAKIQRDLFFDLLNNEKFDNRYLINTVGLISKNIDNAKNQDDVLRVLSKDDRFTPKVIGHILNALTALSPIGQIRRNLVLDLAKDKRFSEDNVWQIIYNLVVSNGTAEIQQDLIQKLIQNKKFSPQDIYHIVLGMREDTDEIARFKTNFIHKNAQDDKFRGSDIANIIFGINFGENDTKAQIDFIKKLEEKGFLENKSITTSLGAIVQDIKTEDDAKNSLKKIEEFNSKGFFENEILKNTPRSAYDLLKYTEKRPEAKIEEVFDYMEKIDFEKLKRKAPFVKEFNFNQYLTFCDYHSRISGKTEFSEDDLTYNGDLTEFLSENYVDAYSLSDLFSIYPMTKREVGKIPVSWFSLLPKKEEREDASNKIYKAISDFQKDKDDKKLAESLSGILKKEIKVEKLDSGAFGTGYQIIMPDAYDTCLKIFDKETIDSSSRAYNIHGEHIEVQMGLFANRNSQDFVRMYFGRVSPGDTQDGFLITQFLNSYIKADDKEENREGRYILSTSDASGNLINGKIIDLGAISVKDSVAREPVSSYDFFEA